MGFHLRRLVFSAMTLSMLSACGPSQDQSETKDLGDNVFGRDLPRKTLSLTFDDGPTRNTGPLARYLASEGIQATFFIQGNKVRGNEAVLQELKDLGHLVANHTWSHPNLTRISVSEAITQLRLTDRAIQPYLTNNIHLFRAPFGAWNRSIANAANNAGLRKYVGATFWDIGGEINSRGHAADWDCWARGWSVTRCANGYFKESNDRGRGIVLAHDIRSQTNSMIQQLVPRWKAAGFRFVRLDQVPNIRRQLEDLGQTPRPGVLRVTASTVMKLASSTATVIPDSSQLSVGEKCSLPVGTEINYESIQTVGSHYRLVPRGSLPTACQSLANKPGKSLYIFAGHFSVQ